MNKIATAPRRVEIMKPYHLLNCNWPQSHCADTFDNYYIYYWPIHGGSHGYSVDIARDLGWPVVLISILAKANADLL